MVGAFVITAVGIVGRVEAITAGGWNAGFSACRASETDIFWPSSTLLIKLENNCKAGPGRSAATKVPAP